MARVAGFRFRVVGSMMNGLSLSGAGLRIGRAAAALFCLLSWAAPASGQILYPFENHKRFSVSLGSDYSSGDYGEAKDTDIWYSSLGFKYEYERWTARVTVPWVRIEGPETICMAFVAQPLVMFSEPHTDASGETASTTVSGLGDVLASLTYTVLPVDASMPGVELTGKVKFPTASDGEYLGTGSYDFSFEAEVFKEFGRWTPYLNLGYRYMGNGLGVELDNVWFGSAGIDLAVGTRTNVGLVYDFRQAALGGIENSQELVPYTIYRFSESIRLMTYAVVGLSDSSADLGMGTNLSFSWE
ncbi:MAG: hypothetical protein VX614_09545 [Myxococcota bacterium]|nr:hypothetical protein [Myxococcota bacterium]